MNLVGKNVGNYRVTRQIGGGGMGAVFLGEHPRIGKKVAIKTLHAELSSKEDMVARFFTEAKAVNDIGHPNIVDIIDFGTLDGDDGQPVSYFIMEFLEGDGLNERLKKTGLSTDEAIHILKQCASALGASHRKHVVHRDLKPDNIYLVRRGDDPNYVKLLDFGIAKLTGDDARGAQHQTRAGLVMGTPSYMSPEQCEGKGQIDWRSDMYSLGCLYFEMLTGRVPFVGEGFVDVLIAHMAKDVPLPSSVRADVPASLEAIVMHMLEKDRERRFQSMDELLVALNDPQAHLMAWGSPSHRTAVDMRAPSPSPSIVRGAGGGDVPAEIAAIQRVTSSGDAVRPTTLSGATGQLALEGSAALARSRTGLYAGLSAAALVAAVVIAFVARGSSAPVVPSTEPSTRPSTKIESHAAPAAQKSGEAPAPTPVLTPAPAPAPVVPTMVKITIDSTPRGAQVFNTSEDQRVGVTPYVIEAKRGSPDFDVILKLPGFADVIRTLSSAGDNTVNVALEPVVAPRPQAAHPRSKRPAKDDKDDVLAPSFLR